MLNFQWTILPALARILRVIISPAYTRILQVIIVFTQKLLISH